jgi:hypothetical protein
MATYKNDYSVKEDRCLWELHEIRAKTPSRMVSSRKITTNAREILKKYEISLPTMSLKKRKKIAKY